MEFFEILDLIYVLVQACGCFLEMTAAGSAVGAGVSAAKVHKNKIARKQAEQAGAPPPPPTPWRWVFWFLLFTTVFLVGLLLWKWLRQ